ncbi:hypothetical protein DSL72_008868 [Monilinia vaccinii-corymbosi]|uniref:MARVEL domain-containing protein n=1 Tax=Monilinia vaccinii-corymbosi TaxID=61207 RepID=A0A8A3PSC2_9HELO|nr:hypothetical protein DSL72_008868 [Monilinia vaccinii-corymbosi]
MATTRGTTRPGTENQEILTGHVLKPNRGVSFLRVLQVILALAILGLAGFVVTFKAYSGASLDLFVASATILIILYILLATHRFTSIYNYWAVACLDLFLVIFWLAAWITSAVQVRRFHGRYGYYGCGWYICRRDLLELEVRDELDAGGLERRASTSYHTFRGVFIAAAVLAAVEFVLFIITFLFTLGKILKHHDQGGHSTAFPKTHAAAAAAPVNRDIEMQAPAAAHTGTAPATSSAVHPETGQPIVSSNPI